MVGINMWMDLFKKVILERGYEYFENEVMNTLKVERLKIFIGTVIRYMEK